MTASNRVLIIKLGALGDVIMATAFLDRIRAAHAGDEIDVLTSPPYADIFRRFEGLRVRAVPRHGLLNALRTVFWMRGRRFRRLYDLQSSDRTAILCALSGVPERVGNLPHYPYTHHPADRYTGQCHIFERMQAVLAAAGLPADDRRPSLPCLPAERDHVRQWLRDHRLLGRSYAVMHAGSSPQWPAKRWPYYPALAYALSRRGIETVWAGARPDAALNTQLTAQTGVDATNEFNFAELAELGRQARFAVTNDSGPMHILAAAGIPVYAFFGPTSWWRSHAVGQRGRVLYNPSPCQACGRADRATAVDHTCLPGIMVDEVLQRLQQEKLCPEVS
ncbi:MAG TPA: glycosyltransferase family 9 protein [Gammaproteobacteria bacterium]|nr:glycosyltransferase family 9 protein [Gammaproteobacteria bacterium]